MGWRPVDSGCDQSDDALGLHHDTSPFAGVIDGTQTDGKGREQIVDMTSQYLNRWWLATISEVKHLQPVAAFFGQQGCKSSADPRKLSWRSWMAHFRRFVLDPTISFEPIAIEPPYREWIRWVCKR